MIEDKDIETLKRYFVTIEDCNSTVDSQDKKFANDDKRLAVIETYQKLTLAVLSAVGVGVLGIVLNIFSGGIG